MFINNKLLQFFKKNSHILNNHIENLKNYNSYFLIITENMYALYKLLNNT